MPGTNSLRLHFLKTAFLTEICMKESEDYLWQIQLYWMREAGLDSRKSWATMQLQERPQLIPWVVCSWNESSDCNWRGRWALTLPNCPVIGCGLSSGRSYNFGQGSPFGQGPLPQRGTALPTLQVAERTTVSVIEGALRGAAECSFQWHLGKNIKEIRNEKICAPGERQIWTKGMVHSKAWGRHLPGVIEERTVWEPGWME